MIVYFVEGGSIKGSEDPLLCRVQIVLGSSLQVSQIDLERRAINRLLCWPEVGPIDDILLKQFDAKSTYTAISSLKKSG
jgi:hypothetical protein